MINFSHLVQEAHFWNGVAFILAMLAVFRPVYRALIGMLDAYAAEIRDDLNRAQDIFKEASELYTKVQKNHQAMTLRVADIRRFSRIDMDNQKALHEEAMVHMEKIYHQRLTLQLERMKIQALENLKHHLVSSALQQTLSHLKDPLTAKTISNQAPHLFATRGFSIDTSVSKGYKGNKRAVN